MSSRSIFSKKVFEQYYPMLICCALWAGLWYSSPDWLTLAACEKLSSPYLTIFSVCFGFVFASVSTLLGLSDKTFLKGMKESGAFSLLISYHWSCIRWCSIGTALGIAVLFWPYDNFREWQGAVFIGVGVGGVLSAWRILGLFAKVIHRISTY